MPTVTPPTGGLIGFSNYNLYDNCENLTGVSVTVDVTEGMGYRVTVSAFS